MKVVHNKLPVPDIGYEVDGWKVVEYGNWGKGKNKVAVFICEHKCGSLRKFTSSDIFHRKFKKCKTCEIGITRAKSGLDIVINKEFRSYKYSAKQRGYEFKLTLNDFKKIVLSDCLYCGIKPSSEKFVLKSREKEWHRGQRYFLNGIDRINNKLGYVIENCAPCCTRCNMSKSTMSLEEWKKMVIKWYSRLDFI